MLQTQRRSGSLLERLNRDTANIAPDPLIEDLAQESPVICRRGRMRTDAVHRSRRSLDHRQKAQILATDFTKKAIDGERSNDIEIVHDAKDVGGNFHFAQEVVGTHRLRVSRLASPGQPIGIVKVSRTIQAEPHTETLICQKSTPGVVQQDAIGLDAISHAPPWRFVLALKVDSLLEETHSQGGRLASVPGEGDIRPVSSIEMLEDILLKQTFRHPERHSIRVKAAFVPVVAIFTVEVAHSSRWLDKDLKLPGTLAQCSFSSRIVILLHRKRPVLMLPLESLRFGEQEEQRGRLRRNNRKISAQSLRPGWHWKSV